MDKLKNGQIEKWTKSQIFFENILQNMPELTYSSSDLSPLEAKNRNCEPRIWQSKRSSESILPKTTIRPTFNLATKANKSRIKTSRSPGPNPERNCKINFPSIWYNSQAVIKRWDFKSKGSHPTTGKMASWCTPLKNLAFVEAKRASMAS